MSEKWPKNPNLLADIQGWFKIYCLMLPQAEAKNTDMQAGQKQERICKGQAKQDVYLLCDSDQPHKAVRPCKYTETPAALCGEK